MKLLAQIRPRLQHLLNRALESRGSGHGVLICYGRDRAHWRGSVCNGGPEVTPRYRAPKPNGSCEQDYGDP